MGRQPRLHFPGAIFHVSARGNGRQTIFFDSQDWNKFLDILGELKRIRPFKLYAYCLMGNHIHLLIEPSGPKLSLIMGLLLARYAKYLNARFKRNGHVFQNRFHARLCGKDSYFQQVIRYIHLNPVEAGLADEPSRWPYSGHLEYLGKSTRHLIDQEQLLSMLGSDIRTARAAYSQFVLGALKDDYLSVGETEDLSNARESDIHFKAVQVHVNEKSLDEICAEFKPISLEILRSSSKVRTVCRARHRFIACAFAAGYSLTEVAAYLGLSLSAVSKALNTKEPKACLRSANRIYVDDGRQLLESQ